ncbi:zinc finger MYM-type protein 1-like [Dysidea avara]|uniref:zinc finger MYM-type protein 1-like n=1 Tax=Dysidea avara TaxID=196820 RepID=UPI0033204B1C
MFGASSSGSTRPKPVFVFKGFRNWKYATGKLFCHANCHLHTQAQIAGSNSMGQHKVNSKQGTTISGRMNSDRPLTISNNRHYIKIIAEVLLLCSRQELGLRGHREGSESVNRDNFLEILHLVAQHDPLVKCRIDHGPRNATYTTPDIQNDMLGVMAELMQEQIRNEVRKAGVYSILADETKDCSKVEQLAVVLKYVDVYTATQHEHFLTYVEAEAQDVASLSAYIISALRYHKQDPSKNISQGTMLVPEASEFFTLLELLYVFMSTSKAHTIYTNQQAIQQPHSPV